MAAYYGVEFPVPEQARPCTADHHWQNGYQSTDCGDGFECMDHADDCDPFAHGSNCAGVCVPAVQAVQINSTRRAGLLTRASFLTSHANAHDPSAVFRGKFIRNRLLCTDIAPPPPDVEDSVPRVMGEQRTSRQRLQAHTQGACAGCHDLMDPLGFGFENFDSIGRWRDLDNEQPIDATGAVSATLDADGPYDGAIELMERLAGSRQVHVCFTENLFRYAHGRRAEMEDEPSLDSANLGLSPGETSIREILIRLTQTDSFRCRPHHEEE